MKKIVIMALILLLIANASARPEYMKDFKNFSDKVKKCTLCHVQSSGYGGLNPFGRDYAKIGSLTPELMQLDSDGDRFSNIEELLNGTMPGDKDSYPGKKAPGYTTSLLLAIIILYLVKRKS
ncbi:conserved hypothetical protein [Ferroglobus placidus DSM 10642]|uniref:Temptin Cys/Cys disulfide domain-containing protein n=1 Tax=Ferroglobus placidus (strain DSM 10642 / AEDII12DO) TaxID=589924 RepID=D3RYE9_FERPA|nr:hypothetical protein [Ferroglobus placidus]ADC65512.1 conserved hypothetical protein [Ferroglobus placidus DSM 10642]